MVKIIAVLGSPTKNGNTCILAREVLRGAVDSGASVEEIFLADYNIEYCRGCINKTEKHLYRRTAKDYQPCHKTDSFSLYADGYCYRKDFQYGTESAKYSDPSGDGKTVKKGFCDRSRLYFYRCGLLPN